jgi:hypothetical protein
VAEPRGIRINIWLPIAVVAAVILVFTAAYWNLAPGVYVTVVNHGPETLHAVTVQVTGRAHVLGDLAPGQSKRRRVLPTSESHAEIEYTDEQGRRVDLGGGGYFEPGYRGELLFEVRDRKVEITKNDIRLY